VLGGREVWLDYQTGDEMVGIVDRSRDNDGDPRLRVIADTLAEMEWPVQVLGEGGVWCPVSGDVASYTLGFVPCEGERALICMSPLPVNVPVEQRVRAADYLNRANMALRDGNFELDPEDGRAEFRTFSRFGDDAHLADTVRRMTHSALVSCERYIRGLLSVVFGGQSPESAIEGIECER
jgi:hypothetical protein